MLGAEGKFVTFWRSRSLKNAFSGRFQDNKCLWDLLVLYYFGYEVVLFQIFFKYQNPENILSYVTNPEFRINPEIFHPWQKYKFEKIDSCSETSPTNSTLAYSTPWLAIHSALSQPGKKQWEINKKGQLG